jgi:hypothetical protein
MLPAPEGLPIVVVDPGLPVVPVFAFPPMVVLLFGRFPMLLFG